MKAVVLALTLIAGGVLAGCAQKAAVPDAGAASAAAPLQPTPGLKANERLQLAIKALQNGDAERAKVELTVFVAEQPRNKVGTGLLAQIDTPIEKYFPRDSFPVSLKPGESLSNIAATYLGDPLEFYALARYNQIKNPSRLPAGQTVRVPKTPTAVAALAKAPAATGPASGQREAQLPAASLAEPGAMPEPSAMAEPALPPAPSQDNPRRAAVQGR